MYDRKVGTNFILTELKFVFYKFKFNMESHKVNLIFLTSVNFHQTNTFNEYMCCFPLRTT